MTDEGGGQGWTQSGTGPVDREIRCYEIRIAGLRRAIAACCVIEVITAALLVVQIVRGHQFWASVNAATTVALAMMVWVACQELRGHKETLAVLREHRQWLAGPAVMPQTSSGPE